MHDDLISVCARVHDEAIAAFGDAFFGGEPRDDGEHAASHGGMIGREVICASEMLIGDDENVSRRKWLNIPKGGDPLILEDLVRGDFAGDDPAENAILVSHKVLISS